MTRADALTIAAPYLSLSDECGDDIDFESALYWWCADHHTGQSSEEYSIMSTSDYSPGILESGPELGSLAEMLYDAFCYNAECTHTAPER